MYYKKQHDQKEVNFKLLCNVRVYRALNPKQSSIVRAIRLMERSKFKIESGQLFILYDQKMIPAFPDIDNQLEILEKLKKCSKSLWETISSEIKLKDLKD